MATPKLFESMTGWWEGTSSLSLPWERKEPYDSPSSLHVEQGPKGAYAHVEYRWSHEGVQHHGVLIIAGDRKAGTISAGWVDSWHQSPSVLNLTGKWTGEDSFSALGHYSAGEGPDWGWRIDLKMNGDKLHLEMTNIHPDGKEEWAVRCDYART